MKDKNENFISIQTPLKVIIIAAALIILPQTLMARGSGDREAEDWEQQMEEVREEARLREESGDGEPQRAEVREEARFREESGDGEPHRAEVREGACLREESGHGEPSKGK